MKGGPKQKEKKGLEENRGTAQRKIKLQTNYNSFRQTRYITHIKQEQDAREKLNKNVRKDSWKLKP